MDVATPLHRQPIVGLLRVAGGKRLDDAAPGAVALTPSPRAARSREGEHLLILLDLSGPASPHLYRELREVVAQTYWSTTGSITAALRQAAAAVNRHLFHINLRSAPAGRCSGNLVCAVLRTEEVFHHPAPPVPRRRPTHPGASNEVFLLQAGSGRACFLHAAHLECFGGREELPPLGMGILADVRLYHTLLVPGDTLLLASPGLVREAGDAGLARALSRPDVQTVQDGLEQVGGAADFTALVVRWALPEDVPVEREAERPSVRPERKPPRPSPSPEREPSRARRPARPAPRGPAPRAGPGLGERLAAGLRAGGHGIVAAGGWLVGGVATLFRSMLPGPARQARRRARTERARPARPTPKENRTAMMAIAIGIPLVLAVVVALVYLSYGAEARVRAFVARAEGELALAQAAESRPEEARRHWEAALQNADAALALRPNGVAAGALLLQARAALDRLDGIVRLQPALLRDFGVSAAPRQLVVHGQTIFVLDRAGGWVAQVTLDPAGQALVEQANAPILVRAGQQIGEGEVGGLVDLAWVSPGDERQTSGLLILEEDGALVDYDPAWVDAAGTPKMTRSFLGTSPTSARAVGTFRGRLYVLDSEANQIWRYDARGDTYPERPERYFVIPPPRSLADALDMAIDGHIYVLYRDGDVLQFLQGEHQVAFAVHGLPDAIAQAVALAVDLSGDSGVVYVADRGNKRVIALGPEGAFQAQYRADEAFDALETLAVDEAARRLYVISNGQLYVATLP